MASALFDAQWAAYTALVNEQGGFNGLGPVGSLNPALYYFAAIDPTSFNDIVIGNTGYLATPG